MSRAQEEVAIIDRRTGNPVMAILHKELDEFELIDVEIVWAPARLQALRELRLNGIPATDLPQHVHWNWAVKAVQNSNLLAFQSFGIEADGIMQGLMTVCLAGNVSRLDPDKGKPLVYVEFVETAPWNSKEFAVTPTYKGVGLRLIQAAVRLSLDEGFSGRIGLHALPQSKHFYTNACEMQALGPDERYGYLAYFELTAVKAVEFLKKGSIQK
ncbi:MAG: hypothetical protein WEB58_14455 [Planctomycetaceae bacterium]